MELRCSSIRSISENDYRTTHHESTHNALIEIKRVHTERAKNIIHDLIKLIRDFCFFDRDRDIITDVTYGIMIAGSAEKSEIRQIIEKFNVNI